MTAAPTFPTPVVADRTAAAVSRLNEVASGQGWGAIEWGRPSPSAAFTRRDSREPGFGEAVEVVIAHGFEPFIRPVGGRLAAYHEGSLVLDVNVRSENPRSGTTERFRVLSAALAQGLRTLGVDARVGEVPGEYCPGHWSVNEGDRTKLIGTGQRLVRGAFLFTAVIVVGNPEPLADVMSSTYNCLGMEMDALTVGSVAQHVPGVTLDDVQEAVGNALAAVLPVSGPDLVGGRLLLDAWDPR